ncbi:MAG TPA: hypothetical protein VK622_14655, partial [Puia sp.]|nr:hypothetical protein [Puia sp.]
MQLTEFIEKIDKPKELFEALNKAQVNTALEFDAILVEFSAQPGVDLCLLALEALKAGANKWITEGIVIPKLNKLSPNVESLALLMNGLEGIIYQKDLEEFLTKTPDFARRLLTKFINENNGFIEGYIITCYNALLKNEEFDSFQEIVDLKSNSSLIIQHSVISLLSSFNYETSSNKDEFLKTTLQVLQEFEQKAESDNELLPRLVWAYCQLITQSEKAEEKLIKLLDKNNPDSDLKLAQFLFVNTDKFYLNEWFQKLLNRLTKVSTQYVETLNRIDMIFFMALARHKSWVGAKEFIRKWLTDSDYTRNKKDFETLFPSFLRELIKNKPELELWITELFNKEDIYWNALAGDTVSYFKSHNMDGLLQLTVDTGSYNIYDIKYIFRKILAFVIYPDVMCSLVLSVLEKKDDEDIKGLVNSMMTEIVDEYL